MGFNSIIKNWNEILFVIAHTHTHSKKEKKSKPSNDNILIIPKRHLIWVGV